MTLCIYLTITLHMLMCIHSRARAPVYAHMHAFVADSKGYGDSH
jgi:hypothetical protein